MDGITVFEFQTNLAAFNVKFCGWEGYEEGFASAREMGALVLREHANLCL